VRRNGTAIVARSCSSKYPRHAGYRTDHAGLPSLDVSQLLVTGYAHRAGNLRKKSADGLYRSGAVEAHTLATLRHRASASPTSISWAVAYRPYRGINTRAIRVIFIHRPNAYGEKQWACAERPPDGPCYDTTACLVLFHADSQQAKWDGIIFPSYLSRVQRRKYRTSQ